MPKDLNNKRFRLLEGAWNLLAQQRVDDRIEFAVKFLQAKRLENPSPENVFEFRLNMLQRVGILQLLIVELFDDFDAYFETLIDMEIADEGENHKSRKQLLIALNSVKYEQLPLVEKYITPRAVLLPRKLYLELLEGISALADGEVQKIIAPEATQQTGLAWTKNRIRVRACEQVYFRRGKGASKEAAEFEVFSLTGIGADTLHAWQRRLRRGDATVARRFDLAREAGRLMSKMPISKPKRSADMMQNIRLVALGKSLDDENMTKIGDAFREEFRKS